MKLLWAVINLNFQAREVSRGRFTDKRSLEMKLAFSKRCWLWIMCPADPLGCLLEGVSMVEAGKSLCGF